MTQVNYLGDHNQAHILRQIRGLVSWEADYCAMALSVGDTTETYTFKRNGAGGTTVGTIVVVYTDSSREVLSTITATRA